MLKIISKIYSTALSFHQLILWRYSMTLQASFTQYAKHLLTEDVKNEAPPLKDHPQIPLILDTLSRQEQHHILLTSTDSEKINQAILESVAYQLTVTPVAQSLKNVNFIFFDVSRFCLDLVKNEQIEQQFQVLTEETVRHGKRLIFALSQADPLLTEETQSAVGCLGKLIKSVLINPAWRIIAFTKIKNHKI